MFNKLKQFNDLRDKAKKLQSTLTAEKVEGSAGFGKVKVVVNGTQEVLSVEIAAALFTPTEKKHTEELVRDAMNDANKKLQRVLADKMKASGSEMDLSALLGK